MILLTLKNISRKIMHKCNFCNRQFATHIFSRHQPNCMSRTETTPTRSANLHDIPDTLGQTVFIYYFDDGTLSPHHIQLMKPESTVSLAKFESVSIPSPRTLFEASRHRPRSAHIPELRPTPRPRPHSGSPSKRAAGRRRFVTRASVT